MKFGHYSDNELPQSDHGYRCASWDAVPDGKKNVVVLGCSHTWGVGLHDDQHWVHYLSNHNTDRLRYWNLGQPGASADLMVRILYGCEKTINPNIIIACWPLWTRRERLLDTPESLTGDAAELGMENEVTDKNNFLKNVFLLEKYAQKNRCVTFHCFAEYSYEEHIAGLNVLKKHTLRNCWPHWDKFEQRVAHDKPDLASDGKHFGEQHHKRFAELFLNYFGKKLK